MEEKDESIKVIKKEGNEIINQNNKKDDNEIRQNSIKRGRTFSEREVRNLLELKEY